jgi:hypothetical protein
MAGARTVPRAVIPDNTAAKRAKFQFNDTVKSECETTDQSLAVPVSSYIVQSYCKCFEVIEIAVEVARFEAFYGN